jgi:hypothetical protein
MELLRDHFLREGHINKAEAIEIIRDATYIMGKYEFYYNYYNLKNLSQI